MSPTAKLPRRQPGTHLDRSTRYIGRARVPHDVTRWSTDLATLHRLLTALRAA